MNDARVWGLVVYEQVMPPEGPLSCLEIASRLLPDRTVS